MTPSPSTPAPQSVAIIGAGITGLTAAFRLTQQGIPVTVYEASGRVGGVIQSIREGGYLAEFGPNSILELSPKITALIHDLGLDARRMYSDPGAENRYLVRYARPIAMPAKPPGFFRTPLFTSSAKLSLLLEPFHRRSRPDVEESLAQFVLRRLGQEFLDYAINPLVAGIYAGDPARLSVKHGFPKLHALEQRYGSMILGQILGARERKRRAEVSKQEAKKISFDEGLQVLTDTLREKLGPNLWLNASVHRIARDGANWTVTAQRDGRETVATHRAVLLAAPAYRLAELKVEAANGGAVNLAPLAEIVYPPVASIVLGYRRQDVAHPLDGFGMLIPQKEGFRILGALFSSSLFPKRAPEGHVTLTCYLGGMRAPELARRPVPEMIQMTHEDLARILTIKGQPTFQHCVLYPRAIPQYEVGYGRFKDLMSSVETQAPGLFFAGHYRDGISLGDSILSAHTAADRLGTFCGVQGK